MTSAQHSRLVELIKELAVVHGRVTLSSGIEADYYVDLRRATLHHEAAPLIGQVMLDMLDAAGISDFDAAGGLTMGADPVGTAIMHQAAARDRKIDAFVVRKAAKAHGMGRQVEGPSVEGRKVIVVEDTSTTGGSPLTAAKALEEAGAIIVAVATVVDRDTGAQKVIEDAGYRYLSAVTLDDLGLR
jgi:orotate phosphoribosyltransferase